MDHASYALPEHYGADLKLFGDFVTKKYLPKERADRYAEQYERFLCCDIRVVDGRLSLQFYGDRSGVGRPLIGLM